MLVEMCQSKVVECTLGQCKMALKLTIPVYTFLKHVVYIIKINLLFISNVLPFMCYDQCCSMFVLFF